MNLTYSKPFTNITNPTQIITGINSTTGNILGVVVLFTVWIIMVVVLLNNGHSLKSSFSAGTYVGLILSWVLWILDMISPTWMYFMLIMTAVALISLFVREGG